MVTANELEIARLLQYDPPYEWRGGNLALIQSREPEVILSGPSDTGKSFAACYKSHMACREYPGAQGALIRQVKADIPGSILLTMKRIIGNFPVEYYGGDKDPSMIIYPKVGSNPRSTIWIGGMDNPGKALSAERDFIQISQAEQLQLNGYETLTTRTSGRGAVMPYTQIFGECNPGGAKHHLLTRQRIRMLKSYHKDNPEIYDKAGEITEQGKHRMDALNALTGFRRKRLRDGLWITVEGAVYEEFDPAVHVIERSQCPPFVRRFRAVDFGYSNPFVCGWYGMDADGALYLYREIYQTRKLVEDLTKQIVQLTGDEQIEFTIADHDAEDRATMHKHGISTIPAIKDVSPGIQAVMARMHVQDNGKARIYYVRDALVEPDPFLADARLPTCTIDELPDYAWQKTQDGRPNKEAPVKVGDHGMDKERYLVYKLDGPGLQGDGSFGGDPFDGYRG